MSGIENVRKEFDMCFVFTLILSLSASSYVQMYVSLRKLISKQVFLLFNKVEHLQFKYFLFILAFASR